MRRATQCSGLELAEAYIREALELLPGNRAFLHSLAELSLRRSRLASDSRERDTWRGRAIDQARRVVH